MKVRVEDYREVLEAELKRHCTRPVSLEIVSDVEAWARANHIYVVGHPIGTSTPERDHHPRAVVIQAELNESEVSGVLGRLDFCGYWAETRELRASTVTFLRHLVLHELAHLENNWDQSREDECDEWAFRRLAV